MEQSPSPECLCHVLQARATPRKRAPAGASDAQPAPWSAVEERAQQQALPGPGSADQPSAEAEPMQVGFSAPCQGAWSMAWPAACSPEICSSAALADVGVEVTMHGCDSMAACGA